MTGVDITHPDKVLFPADGITKADLAGYYERVAEWMLPHISFRPVSMQRFPDGIERKARLRRALRFADPVRLNPHRNGEHGEEVYRQACEKGLEGVIAKRADSPYLSGGRSRDWLKLKCHAEQELVIGGYTAPKGTRTEFGALLVGYYQGGTLRYAGKVGTGFDHHRLRTLGESMREREQGESPFERFKPIPPGTHWVSPELVAQIGFTEWTRDGRLRHPRFLGLRDDKPAREVVREVPS